MRAFWISSCICLLTLAVAGCGDDSGDAITPAAIPVSGREYRALDAQQRAAVAASCKNRAAATARGLAGRELSAIDPMVLREELDTHYRVIVEQRRPVAEVCRELIPFVTPGLQISFDGATDVGDTFNVQTSSKTPLTMSGRVTPPAASGRVLARRELAPSDVRSANLTRDGHFKLPTARLRKVADNTFTVTVKAPPHAPRKVLFTAICLDCLTGGPPPVE